MMKSSPQKSEERARKLIVFCMSLCMFVCLHKTSPKMLTSHHRNSLKQRVHTIYLISGGIKLYFAGSFCLKLTDTRETHFSCFKIWVYYPTSLHPK